MQRRRIASTRTPAVTAAIEGFFRFRNEAQARAQLSRFAQQYIISRDQPPPEDTGQLQLWIRGFGLEGNEEKEGYLGHFARLSVTRLPEGRVTITAEKMPIDLRFHPQKMRPRRTHPDWGHPFLRNVKKGHIFPTREEARMALLKLHEEFPEASIPGIDKLNILIYHRQEGSERPIQKLLLAVEPAEPEDESKGFTVRAREPRKKSELPERASHPPLHPEGADSPAASSPQNKGYFANLVEKQRKKKKK